MKMITFKLEKLQKLQMVLTLIEHQHTQFMKELLQKILGLNELNENFMEKVKKQDLQLEQIILILKKQSGYLYSGSNDPRTNKGRFNN